MAPLQWLKPFPKAPPSKYHHIIVGVDMNFAGETETLSQYKVNKQSNKPTNKQTCPKGTR